MAGKGFVGAADHGGWAIVVSVDGRGRMVDRRRVELVEEGLPKMPHHCEGQEMGVEEAVALVERVRVSAERCARGVVEGLEKEFGARGIALRACQELPETVAERLTDYRAKNVADWVMYRRALAQAAEERGWRVHWYDARKVGEPEVEGKPGRPWTQDHRQALAAAQEGLRG